MLRRAIMENSTTLPSHVGPSIFSGILRWGPRSMPLSIRFVIQSTFEPKTHGSIVCTAGPSVNKAVRFLLSSYVPRMLTQPKKESFYNSPCLSHIAFDPCQSKHIIRLCSHAPISTQSLISPALNVDTLPGTQSLIRPSVEC